MDHSRSVTEIKTLSKYVLGKWKLCCCEVCDIERKIHKEIITTTVCLKWGEVIVTQPCLTLCDTMDCIVHGILQARILEWVATPFSRGFSRIKIDASLNWRFLMKVYEVLKVTVVTHLNDTFFPELKTQIWTCTPFCNDAICKCYAYGTFPLLKIT